MLALGFAAFLIFGVVLVLAGASQDALAAALGLDLARSGFIASTLSLGVFAGMLLAGPLVDRFPRRPLYVASILCCGAPLVLVSPDMSYPRLLAYIALLGIGGGFYDILLTVVCVQRYGTHAARMVTFLHAAATLGAVIGPFIIAFLTGHGGWTVAFRVTGFAYLAYALWAAAARMPAPVQHGHDGGGAPLRDIFAPRILALCAVAFAYVGVEAGVTIFSVPYAHGGLGLDPDRGRSAISALWFGLLLGRLALVGYRGVVDARVLVGGGAVGAVLFGAGVIAGVPQVELIFACAGFALGPSFPVFATLAAQAAPRAAGRATALVAGMGAFGGFAVPWLTGIVGDAAGIRLAMSTFTFWLAAIAAGALLAHRLPGASDNSPPTSRT